jgi:Flp pilus assembly protein TadG
MARGHRGTGNTLRLFGRLRAFGAETLSMVGDHRGAVAFEFALISLPMLLLCAGIFGVGVVMIQDMELNFVVENAAKVEVAGQDGAAWAKAQLGSPVSVTANPSSCGGPGVQAAQATGTWPVSLGVFQAMSLTLSAQACAVK